MLGHSTEAGCAQASLGIPGGEIPGKMTAVRVFGLGPGTSSRPACRATQRQTCVRIALIHGHVARVKVRLLRLSQEIWQGLGELVSRIHWHQCYQLAKNTKISDSLAERSSCLQWSMRFPWFLLLHTSTEAESASQRSLSWYMYTEVLDVMACGN